MVDTQLLLSKIAALRQQLEQAQPLTNESGPATTGLPTEPNDEAHRMRQLEQQVMASSEQNALLDRSLRQMAGVDGPIAGDIVWPLRLTVRGRKLLERGRELIARLRILSGEPLLGIAENSLLDVRFRETTAMADTALRVLQAFPDAPGAQLRLCDGLEAILDVVAERITDIAAALDQRRQETAWVEHLADWLAALAAEKDVQIKHFLDLAEELLACAQQGKPMQFFHARAEQPARFIACHSLVVAQVIARVIGQDPDLRGRPLEPVLAAFVHDVGMLRVPAEILTQPGPLTDDQRRVIESHTSTGADLAARLWPTASWLAEAAAGHHERLDGTGYPNGRREIQIVSLNRLLAVCDVYAALCAPRSYRPARETRTALTDTLMLAEQGSLDRYHAERLLALSFYPVGSVVELADGSVGAVVATHPDRHDLSLPARPVLALLVDARGQLLPAPQYLDLAQADGHSIIRSLPPVERRQLLGKKYPQAA